MVAALQGGPPTIRHYSYTRGQISEVDRLLTIKLLIILSYVFLLTTIQNIKRKNPYIYVELQGSQLYGPFVSLLTTNQKSRVKIPEIYAEL